MQMDLDDLDMMVKEQGSMMAVMETETSPMLVVMDMVDSDRMVKEKDPKKYVLVVKAEDVDKENLMVWLDCLD